jgi:hypothetical protein
MNNGLKALVQGNPSGVFGARWAAIDALQVIPLLSERLYLGSRPAATHRQRWELELYEMSLRLGDRCRGGYGHSVSTTLRSVLALHCASWSGQSLPGQGHRRHRKAAAPGPGWLRQPGGVPS